MLHAMLGMWRHTFEYTKPFSCSCHWSLVVLEPQKSCSLLQRAGVGAVLTGEASPLATSVTSCFFFSGFSLSCGVAAMAVDYLHPRPVYRLEYVATDGVHVSIAGIFPHGRPFFLLPALSVIGTLFTSALLITRP